MWDRDRIRGEIQSLLDAVLDGRGATLFLSGEAGIGKTSHLAEACDLATPRIRVARARGDSMESALAFGLLTQALGDLGAPDLLNDRDDTAPVTEVRAAKFFGALRSLDSCAVEQPLLLVLDDVHWADPDSLELLSFLSRRLGTRAIGIIATLRPWPPAAHDLARHLEHSGHATVSRVPRLSRAAAAALLAERCGGAIAGDVVERAWSVCAGNPLLLEQVALAIRRGEGIPGLEAGRVAPRSETLLLSRFAGIAQPGVCYAQAGCVLGISFRPAVAAEIARLDEEAERRAIEALAGSGLVRPAASGMEFAHPLFAQALYDDIPDGVRRVLHRRAFGALLDRGLTEEAAEHAVRADLVGDQRAIAVLSKAGVHALHVGALSTAVGRLRAALALAGESRLPEIELALARALLEAGRPTEAIAAGVGVLDIGGPAERASALRLLGVAHYAAGEHDAAASRFDEAVALAESGQPDVAVTSLLLHAVLLSLTAGPAAALREVLRARAMASQVDGALRRRVEGTWGYIAVLAGDPAGCEGALAGARALIADPPAAAVRRGWREITMYGAAAKYVERLQEAEDIYARWAPLAQETELPGAVAALCTGYGEIALRGGRLVEALASTDRACEVTELATHVTATLATVNRAHLLLLMGRLEESDAWCDRGEEMARRGRGAWLPLLRAWDVRGQRWLRNGESEHAGRIYRQAMDLVLRVGLGEPCVVTWAGHAISAHLAAGDADEARRVLAWLDRCAARLPCRWPRIVSAIGHARLLERDGEHAAA
ncbi:MAG TPA: AAA family ATPase [Solirubrobacteraceae bacterium]|nr:AAA family ATPase [Solirubrobacteraceae bacterium]